MRKIAWPTWQKGSWTLLFFAFGLALFFKPPLSDPDLGWHLKNAEKIVKFGSFPLADTYSWTVPAYQWADSYWLTEVLIYKLKEFFGFGGLAAFFALLTSVFLTLFFLKKWPQIWISWWGTLVAIVSVILIEPFVGARAQTISLVFFATLYLWLDDLVKKGLFSSPGWLLRPGAFLFFFFLFWANLHAGFVMGLVLLAIFVFWQVFEPIYSSLLDLRQFQFKYLSPLLLLLPSLLATFINPYGLSLWQTIFNDAASPLIKRNILEWLPPSPQSSLGMLFFLVLFITFGLLIFPKKRKAATVDLWLFFIFAFFGLVAYRNIPLFSLVFASLILKLAKHHHAFEKKFLLPLVYLPLFLLILTITAFWHQKDGFKAVISDFPAMAKTSNLPYEAVEFLKNYGGQDLRLFNEYGWGGYLIWQTDIKTFIDGRMCGWKTDGVNVFQDYLEIMDLKIGFEDKIKHWRINVFLIRKDSYLAAWLRLNPEFGQAYEDELAVVFVKSEQLP